MNVEVVNVGWRAACGSTSVTQKDVGKSIIGRKESSNSDPFVKARLSRVSQEAAVSV